MFTYKESTEEYGHPQAPTSSPLITHHTSLLDVHTRSSECSLAEIKTLAVQCIRYHHAAGRVLLEKLTATPLAKKFPAFYGTPYHAHKNLPLARHESDESSAQPHILLI
jgi:hypothetical protein